MNRSREEMLATWAEIQGDPKAIIRCGEEWKADAQLIGCELVGFDNGRNASFRTPDGNTIEVGPKFRAALRTLARENDGG